MSSDLGIALLRSGYHALPEARARSGGQDSFGARLLGRRTLVVRGADGVRLFYDASVVERHRAVPAALSDLLFGHGAIHGLDGAAHLLRKRLFLEVLGGPRVSALVRRAGERLAGQVEAWPGRDVVVVFNELATAYGFAVLEWAGVRCAADEAHGVVRELALIVDGFGGAGPAYLRGWRARLAMNHWARGVVEGARSGARRPAPDSALAVLAGSELSSRKAAVALLNLLRPTVAVAWLGTFAVLALHEHPEWRSRMGVSAEAFAHEVRRTFPFVPALSGVAARPFEHEGRRHPAGTRVLLDVPGTNTDPRLWEQPGAFRPERFEGWTPDPWSFVPQGGGRVESGHRCPGEPATVALLAETLRVLAEVDFEMDDDGFDRARIPTAPRGGLRLRNVRLGVQP